MAAVAVMPAAVLAAQLLVTQQVEMLNVCCMAGTHHVAVDWAVLHLADTPPSAAA
jgi:hypothetical protein